MQTFFIDPMLKLGCIEYEYSIVRCVLCVVYSSREEASVVSRHSKQRGDGCRYIVAERRLV
jgi:hypothetical protein